MESEQNVEAPWSCEGIMHRYREYCSQLNEPGFELAPRIPEDSQVKRTWSVMEQVIEGIERGDAACKLIGIDLIETDERLIFGNVMKSNAARALRNLTLTEDEISRLRKRIVSLLISGRFTSEFKQYSRLLKKIGLGEYQQEIEMKMDRSNPYVVKYYQYLIS